MECLEKITKFKKKNELKPVECEIMTTFKDFVGSEQQRLVKEKEEYLEKADFPGLFTPVEGENEFEVNVKVVPRNHDFGDGVRVIFRVLVDGCDRDWAVNPRNPIYDELTSRLVSGQTEFVLLRTGLKQKTRYKFLDKEKPQS